MRPSTLSAFLAHGGALLLVFGLAARLSSGHSPRAGWFAGLAVAGAVCWALGYLQRKPSQRRAYGHYLQEQDTADLTHGLAQAWMDDASRGAVEEELRRRKPSGKA